MSISSTSACAEALLEPLRETSTMCLAPFLASQDASDRPIPPVPPVIGYDASACAIVV